MIFIRKKGGKMQKSGFMQLSQKTEYGFLLLSELADSAETVSLKQFADKNKLSFYFLQKVALELRQAGLIEAERGKTGGYRITKTPNQIKILEIIEALEGKVGLMHCLKHGPEQCLRESKCTVKKGFGIINKMMINTLSKFTLKDFINSK